MARKGKLSGGVRILAALVAAFFLGLSGAYYWWAPPETSILMLVWALIAITFAFIAFGKRGTIVTVISESPRVVRYRGIVRDALTSRLPRARAVFMALSLSAALSACVTPVREVTRLEYVPAPANAEEVAARERATKQGVGPSLAAALYQKRVAIDDRMIIDGSPDQAVSDLKVWGAGLITKAGGVPVIRAIAEMVIILEARRVYDYGYASGVQTNWVYPTLYLSRVLPGGGLSPELSAQGEEPFGGYNYGAGSYQQAIARQVPCLLYAMRSGEPGWCRPVIFRTR